MLKIGLTGGIASGKSTVCQLFSAHGIEVIDADIIARQLVEPDQPCLKTIIQTFGKKVLFENGDLDRAQLRQLIFADDNARQQLESILHPRIRQQLIKLSDDATSPYCILTIPLLIEANMIPLVDRVLVIDLELTEQLNRVCQRDNISPLQAKAIISSQSSASQRNSVADDIINNNNSPESLTELVSQLHKKYLDIVNTMTTGCQ
ncbi:dephospho-CoA kinase [Methylophaga sp. 42_25_T18]|nr:dephospho-CoA kinase [Methylophaga sp. 42_25_T18]OUR86085.1 dephospho-CoA kinase [Methylophaga sp. 42_8_T64]